MEQQIKENKESKKRTKDKDWRIVGMETTYKLKAMKYMFPWERKHR